MPLAHESVEMSHWYFAYGSNMSRAVFEGRRRIAAASMRRGYVDGFRVCFNIPIGEGERAVANLVESPGARTHGVAYELTTEQCDHLDRTEAVHLGVYRRHPLQVVTTAGDAITAFTYVSAIDVGGRKPSARYLGLILQGAREKELPEDYVRLLESFELARDERLGAFGELPRT